MSTLAISRSTLRAAAAWVASGVLALTGVLTSPLPGVAAPAYASKVHVTHAMFGLHDGTAAGTSVGGVHEGWVRLWDTGVQWRDIETSPGRFHSESLDAQVSRARSHHAHITMVVAMTPSFYSASPTTVPARKIGRYKTFVRRLMTRYKGRIDSYQVWNESNIATFWTSTPRRMAELTKAMYDVRNAVDRKAKIVAPPLVTRLQFELNWIKTYETQKLNGKPVWRFYDVVALSLYPLARYNGRSGVPEDSIRLLNAAKKELRRSGVPSTKPIWDTEINYGLQSGSKGGTAAAPVSDSRQAANVIRTFVLQAANNVRRIAWYRYDWGRISGGGTLGNTLLTNPDDVTRVTAAGRAYAMVQKWMHGTLQGRPGRRPCAKDARGTYTCVVTDSSGTRRIYWNPFRRAKVQLASGARHKQGALGAITSVKGGSTLTVDFRPVLVYR